MKISHISNPRRAAAGLIVLTILACAAVIAAVVFWNRARANDLTLGQTRTELEVARRQASELQAQLNAARNGTGALQEQLENAKASVARLTREVSDAQTATRRLEGELEKQVKGTLVQDPVVKALDVGVDTYKGVVQLNGFVDTPEQKARAEQIAREVAGVSEVQNKLSVKAQTAR